MVSQRLANQLTFVSSKERNVDERKNVYNKKGGGQKASIPGPNPGRRILVMKYESNEKEIMVNFLYTKNNISNYESDGSRV